NIRVACGNQKALSELHDIEVWAENRCIDELVVVSVITIRFQQKRRLFLNDRSADTAAKLSDLKRSALAGTDRKWIPRVQTLTTKVDRSTSAKLVSSRPRKDVDATRGLIVLSGKRILIDANFSDGFLRG